MFNGDGLYTSVLNVKAPVGAGEGSVIVNLRVDHSLKL